MDSNHHRFKDVKETGPLELVSPAKINLFLKVTGKRADGYHLLFSLMVQVGIYDRISMEISDSESTINCDHPYVPEDERNLALRAAELFFKELKGIKEISTTGIKINLKKNIPVGAGLGGGSSNAAAILSGLNRYFSYPFSVDRLMQLGVMLGADVPFFIFNQPSLAQGIGEMLEAYRKIDPFKVVLVYPGFSIPTATVFKNFNLRLTKSKKEIRNFLFKNKKFDPKIHLSNDLEAVAFCLHPELAEIKASILSLGASGALMSGSGSSIFGLFEDSQTAQRAYETLCQKEDWRIYLTNLVM